MRPRTSGSSAISSGQSIYYMVKVLLAVFVGLFRGEPVRGPPRSGGGARTRMPPRRAAPGAAAGENTHPASTLHPAGTLHPASAPARR